MLHAGVLAPLVGLLGGLGLLFVAVAILRRGVLLGAGLFSLAAEYALVETTGRVAAGSVVAYAVGLVLLCELLLWLAELPSAAAVDRRIVVDRLLALAAVGSGAALAALVVLAATGLRVGTGFEAALLGTAAALALLALPLLLVRSDHGASWRARPATPGRIAGGDEARLNRLSG
jgi:hypothetical protein